MSERMKPWAITREELDVKFDYADGRITLRQYNRRMRELRKQGKIKRDGRTIR